MQPLVNCKDLSKSYGSRQLFSNLNITINTGERVALIGPNGAGKSTLLKIMAGLERPDRGEVVSQKGVLVSYLPQVPHFEPEQKIGEIIAGPGPLEVDEQQRLSALMSQLGLEQVGADESTPVGQLSGGWKKRVAMAQAIYTNPQLLLLDEPTNHLDIEGIEWLEQWIMRSPMSVLTITHDRVFLQKVSQRILELDPRHEHGILSIKGNYQDYLTTRELLLNAQELQEQKLKNTLRRETEWLGQGAKARTTKQQARIQQAEQLKQTVAQLSERNQRAQVQMNWQESGRSSKKLIDAKGISKHYGERTIIPTLNLTIFQGRKVGILGRNGSGKSTLLKLLLGHLLPDEGVVERAPGLEVIYFQQHREALDPELSLKQTICPAGDFVSFGDQRQHVTGYLKRFLFAPEQLERPVKTLSGGEQSRLVLAKLMLNPAQLLVMDEPTNDLDLATLQVLEEVLTSFEGALLLVSHDRYFLDQVCDQIIYLCPKIQTASRDPSKGEQFEMESLEVFEGLSQWEAFKKQRISNKNIGIASDRTAVKEKKQKLSFNEQKELGQIQKMIEEKERSMSLLTNQMQLPEMVKNPMELKRIGEQVNELQREIEKLFERWSELDQRQ